MATLCTLPSLFLPEDIIIGILLRLPVKSLLRFRSVCKGWLALIGSSCFVAMRIHHHRHHDHTVILSGGHLQHCLDGFVLHKDDGTEDSLHQLHIPTDSGLEFLGSSNGLLCFYGQNPEFQDYLLCNPATRQHRLFSCPFEREEHCWSYFYSEGDGHLLGRIIAEGFGFCPNDYFFIAVFQRWPAKLRALVWRMSTNCWKEIEILKTLLFEAPYGPTGSVVVKGVWHLLAVRMEKPFILCFNLLGEEVILWEIGIPNQLVSSVNRYSHLSIMEYKDLLALCVTLSTQFDMWVIKDGTWTKVVTIGPFIQNIPTLLQPCNNSNKFMLLGCVPHGETSRPLCHYDPSTRNLKVVTQVFGWIKVAHKYVESLVSVYSS